MTDLLYPNPSDFSYTREKLKIYAFMLIAFLIGIGVGIYSDLPPKPEIPEPQIIFDPAYITNMEQVENELDTWTAWIIDRDDMQIDLSGREWYYNESWTLYMHPHNTTLTEYYFDQNDDLRMVSNSTETIFVDFRFLVMYIVPIAFPVSVTFYFWVFE